MQIKKTKKRRNYYICENNAGIGQGCYYISWNKPKVGEKFVPNNEVDIELYEQDEKKISKKSSKTSTKKATSKKTTKKAGTKNKTK